MKAIGLLASSLLLFVGAAQASPLDDFANPPASAKPWVYWFWLDGNITREGITADLESMARTGIGGALIREVAQGIPPGPVRFATQEWRKLFAHAASEANRLGLEINMNDDAGWCGSGGPWITPDKAMQKVVWSSVQVTGPGPQQLTLPQPPTRENYYRDIAVVAIPLTAEEQVPFGERQKNVRTSDASIDAKAVLNAETPVVLPKPSAGKMPWIEFEFPQPFEARSLSMAVAEGQMRMHVQVQTSEDGKTYTDVREADFSSNNGIVSFPAKTSRYWRVVFTAADSPLETLQIAGLELSPSPRIENIAGKSARELAFVDWPSDDSETCHETVADLSSSMNPDGTFTWNLPPNALPANAWRIYRFGYTPTGATNSPAAPDATGLECDKLSPEGIDAQFAGLMQKLVDDTGGPGANRGAGLTMSHIDSWEMGSQNWTARFRNEFERRRGYDLLPWLPTLAGEVVFSRERSERFLWDYRRTVGELLVDNYAGRMRELCNKNGLKLSIEAYGNAVFDNLVYAGRADVPMSEFWIGGSAMPLGKAMSSAAHTYGRPITAAESFTASDTAGKWLHHPFTLKPLGDEAFCEGVNRFVFHRFAMQPWLDRAPGMTMGPWGVHYERTETWWEQSGPWHAYLARCQYLLQKGQFQADVCYLMTESVPNDAVGRAQLAPSLPPGYDYDACTAEAAMQFEVRDGALVLPSGMRYALLCLPHADRMTPALAHKLQSLLEAGARIVGPPPRRSPGLTDYPQCDKAVAQFGETYWDPDNRAESLGNGKAIRGGASLEPVLRHLGLPPDFDSRPYLRHIHRRDGDTDYYFVANPADSAIDAVATFRVTGKQPELWRPETGATETVAVYEDKDGVTHVPFRLEPYASVFVVFRGPENASQVASIARDGKPVLPRVEFGPKFTVAKAVYGVLDDPARTRDVRKRVQQLVDEGERVIDVSSLAKPDDPALNVVKTLRIDYTAGDKAISVTGKDGQSVRLSSFAPHIEVQKVVYGVLNDPARTRDRQAFVQRLVDAGQYRIPVSSLASEEDPAVGVVKTAVVDFTVDGKPSQAKGNDSETLDLAVPPAVHAEHILDARRDDQGRLLLEAWQPGNYDISATDGTNTAVSVPELPAPIEIAGPWQLTFPPKLGAPEKVAMDSLHSWSEDSDPGVRHFSGTAVYEKDIDIPEAYLKPNLGLYLDLGEVRVIATVTLNGTALATCWAPPFRVDISKAARPGTNHLSVAVSNLWVNRLIGDEQLPEDSDRNPEGNLRAWPQWLLDGQPSPTGRIAFSTWRLWKKDDPLQPSGLLGPVRLIATQRIVR
jgi:hypothetical protein